MAKRKQIDWEKVEGEYRAGALSVKEVGRRNGCTDTAIHKKAKLKGWKRDLLAKVNQEAKNKLVCQEVCTSNLSEEDIIDAASSEIADVVKLHRKDIGAGQLVVRKLIDQLKDAALSPLADSENGEPGDPKTLQVYSSVAVNLSNAMKSLIGLSRQAYNFDDVATGESGDLAHILEALHKK